MSSESGTGQTVITGQKASREDGKHPEVAYRLRPKVVQSAKLKRPDKLQRLISYLLDVNDHKFTGYIKINFTQGAVGRIEKFEEILGK